MGVEFAPVSIGQWKWSDQLPLLALETAAAAFGQGRWGNEDICRAQNLTTCISCQAVYEGTRRVSRSTEYRHSEPGAPLVNRTFS